MKMASWAEFMLYYCVWKADRQHFWLDALIDQEHDPKPVVACTIA
jgi:hypothetical protein